MALCIRRCIGLWSSCIVSRTRPSLEAEEGVTVYLWHRKTRPVRVSCERNAPYIERPTPPDWSQQRRPAVSIGGLSSVLRLAVASCMRWNRDCSPYTQHTQHCCQLIAKQPICSFAAHRSSLLPARCSTTLVPPLHTHSLHATAKKRNTDEQAIKWHVILLHVITHQKCKHTQTRFKNPLTFNPARQYARRSGNYHPRVHSNGRVVG